MLAGIGSSISPADSLAARSFSFQYVSLVLIVIAFVVGALMRGPEVPAEPANVAPLKKTIVAEPIGVQRYQDLFLAQGTRVRRTTVAALAEFLRNHDVAAQIRINAETEAQSFEFLVARAVALGRAADQAGVPSEALNISVVPQVSDYQASARFFRQGG